MKMTFFWAVILLPTILFCQKNDTLPYFEKTGRERVFQMNMSPLVTQIAPFNRSNPLVTGPYMVNFKKYNNNSALRFGLGANLRFLSEEPKDQVFNMHIGWERRKRIGGRVAMNAGVDGFLSIGGFNFDGSQTSGNDSVFDTFEGGIGVGPVWGIEYAVTHNISLATETAFHIPIASTLGFFLVPPTAIYVNYRFFK